MRFVPPRLTARVPVVSESATPREEVAVTPVPPEVTARGVASVSAPVDEKEEVAVEPNPQLPRQERAVVEAFANAAVPENVGDAENTKLPEPVSSVTAEERLELEGVARNVAMPEPSPETPVLMGNPVAFVRTREAGVPSHDAPETVSWVVVAPPFMEKSPLVIVEEAEEINPLVKVARPPEVKPPDMVSVPRVASCEKRLVDDAVVEKRFVVVAFARVVFPVTPRVPATERFPEESIVVVALPPKYAVPKFEKRVEEAFANLWRAVQMLAFPILRAAVTAAVSEPEFETVRPPASARVAT